MDINTLNTTHNRLPDRITVNPEICHGKPTIRNMRYPVETILDLLSSNMTFAEITDDHPAIEEDDIPARLATGGFFMMNPDKGTNININ